MSVIGRAARPSGTMAARDRDDGRAALDDGAPDLALGAAAVPTWRWSSRTRCTRTGMRSGGPCGQPRRAPPSSATRASSAVRQESIAARNSRLGVEAAVRRFARPTLPPLACASWATIESPRPLPRPLGRARARSGRRRARGRRSSSPVRGRARAGRAPWPPALDPHGDLRCRGGLTPRALSMKLSTICSTADVEASDDRARGTLVRPRRRPTRRRARCHCSTRSRASRRCRSARPRRCDPSPRLSSSRPSTRVSSRSTSALGGRDAFDGARRVGAAQLAGALEPQAQGGERRAQLVGGIGGEPALLVESASRRSAMALNDGASERSSGAPVRSSARTSRSPSANARSARVSRRSRRVTVRERIRPDDAGEQHRRERDHPEGATLAFTASVDDLGRVGEAHRAEHLRAAEHRHGDVEQLLPRASARSACRWRSAR